MQLIMLKTKEIPDPPKDVEIQEFGNERIIEPSTGKSVEGISVYVSGPSQSIADWLRPFDGIWISDNPMLGKWQVVHVK